MRSCPACQLATRVGEAGLIPARVRAAMQAESDRLLLTRRCVSIAYMFSSIVDASIGSTSFSGCVTLVIAWFRLD